MNSEHFVLFSFIFLFCIMNKTFSDLDSIIQLSKDIDTLGFDLSAGQTWIYPTNYQIRDYQYNITQAALHNNTLVSLPTGLGKTFIAAVVMYNFYRWYPMGKIIFMAPTRPLVKQQQDACYNIMAIPPDATAEMTGNKVKASREKIWKEKRVFFITPQILQNDIDVVLDLAQQIKCLVIDEAHKALGKNANCEAIKKIHKINKYFRVLALSATPGSNFNSIKDVITNLLISHIEARTNASIDVSPYVFERKLETFVIPITGQLLAIKDKYIMILDKYTRPLLQFNIFSGKCSNLTKGRVVLTMKEFKEKGRHHAKYNYILKTLNLCVTLYHGYELLIRHGLRGFLVFFDGTISKPLLNSIQELHGILDDVRSYIGPQEEVGMLPDGSIPEVDGPIIFSHPKFEKLGAVIIEHFKAIEDGDTRVMVFCEYRESVMEIYKMLLRHRPLIKPRVFLGQGAISQAQQLQAVKQFKSGICNTLISTCIGEEGLDVGEVDLIVCFDISSKSPIRMVQRMGRTGRKRDGRVVVLVTEGKEQQLLSDCMIQKDNMISLLESRQIKQQLYIDNPKMIPENMKPTCNKMFITVKEPEKSKKNENKKKNNKVARNSNTLKNMFDNISSQSTSKTEEEDPAFITSKKKTPIKASKGSKKLQVPSKNQMDLRSMFCKISSTQNTLNSSIVCSQNHSDTTEECSELNTLVTKIKKILNTNITKSRCKICDMLDSKLVCSTISKKPSMNWTKPNLSILNSVTSESLTKFSESTSYKNNTLNNKTNSFDSAYFNISTKINTANNSLQFFNLKSTLDVFSDDSTEMDENIQNTILFNHSIGIFESSKIYHSPAKLELNKKQFHKQDDADCIDDLNKNVEDDIFETEEDIIEVSDCDSLSPVLCSQRMENFKQKIQQRFSQSQTITDSINSDNNQQTSSKLDDTFITKTNKLHVVKQDSAIEQNINNSNIKVINEKVSDCDSLSPVLCSQRFENFKQKTQQRFSQSQTITESINSDNNQQTSSKLDYTFITKTNQLHVVKQDSAIEQNINNSNIKVINENILEHTNVTLQKCSTPKQYNLLDAEQSSTICKNSKISSPNTISKNELNMVFWDESLFEYNSDESLFEDENEKNYDQNTSLCSTDKQNEIVGKLNTSTEKMEEIISPSCADKQNDIIDKLSIENNNRNEKSTDKQNEMVDKLNHSIEDNDTDSDATLILSFDTDQLLANIEKENSKFENKVEIAQPAIVVQKSVNNSTINSSLLSVTQAINLLNEKSLDNSIINDGNKNEEHFNKSLPNQTSNLLQNTASQENKTQLSKNIEDNLKKNSFTEINPNVKNCEEVFKENDTNNKVALNTLEISEIFKDFEDDSEEELSLLNFSQHRKRKLEKISNHENNKSKFSRTDFDINKQNNTPTNIVTNLLNNDNNSNIAKSLCNNIRKLENDKIVTSCHAANKNDNDFQEINHRLTPSQNTNKMRNKKLKLQLTKPKDTVKKSDYNNKRNLTQISPLKVAPKKVNINNPVVILSDSDDDFEVRPIIKPVSKLVTPVKKLQRTNSVPCYSKSNENSSKNIKNVPKSKNIKSKKKTSAFIDDEAEVEDDEHYETDSDSEKDSEELDSSFVSYTQNVHDQTDMRAKYLQSIRSPNNKPGAFKIPNRPPRQIYDNVFSQIENYENETYMDDSFCVGNDEILSQREGMSYLEAIEAQLEEKCAKQSKKRKRIITLSDSD